jgi:hypothetical protein
VLAGSHLDHTCVGWITPGSHLCWLDHTWITPVLAGTHVDHTCVGWNTRGSHLCWLEHTWITPVLAGTHVDHTCAGWIISPPASLPALPHFCPYYTQVTQTPSFVDMGPTSQRVTSICNLLSSSTLPACLLFAKGTLQTHTSSLPPCPLLATGPTPTPPPVWVPLPTLAPPMPPIQLSIPGK